MTYYSMNGTFKEIGFIDIGNAPHQGYYSHFLSFAFSPLSTHPININNDRKYLPSFEPFVIVDSYTFKYFSIFSFVPNTYSQSSTMQWKCYSAWNSQFLQTRKYMFSRPQYWNIILFHNFYDSNLSVFFWKT